MSHFNIMDSGIINSETNWPCRWILTNQWELIFNPDQEHSEIHSTDLACLLDNDFWRNNVRSVSFNEDIHISEFLDCNGLFHDYTSLISADLQDLNFKGCSNFDYMFYNCSSLKHVIFPTVPFGETLESIDYMFANCKHLHDIDLTNINSNFLYSMKSAFANCSELTFVNLSNIKLGINCETCESCMYGTFHNCTHLHHCLLPAASLINDIDLRKCFSNCTHLNKIDLSTFYYQFDTNEPNGAYSYIKMENCFENCLSLEQIRLPNLYPGCPVRFHDNDNLNKE